jgi:hypothetical protein
MQKNKEMLPLKWNNFVKNVLVFELFMYEFLEGAMDRIITKIS